MKHLILLGLLAISSHSFGQSLWQKAEIGMSVESVQQMYPEAQRPDAKSIADNTYQNGASMLLRIPSHKIGRQTFDVRFIFLQEKLSKVSLYMVLGNSGIGRMHYTELGDRLKAKYGREISVTPSEVTNPPVGQEFTTLWISGKVDIMLRLNILDQNQAFLEVRYGTDLVAEASKL